MGGRGLQQRLLCGEYGGGMLAGGRGGEWRTVADGERGRAAVVIKRCRVDE